MSKYILILLMSLFCSVVYSEENRDKEKITSLITSFATSLNKKDVISFKMSTSPSFQLINSFNNYRDRNQLMAYLGECRQFGECQSYEKSKIAISEISLNTNASKALVSGIWKYRQGSHGAGDSNIEVKVKFLLEDERSGKKKYKSWKIVSLWIFE